MSPDAGSIPWAFRYNITYISARIHYYLRHFLAKIKMACGNHTPSSTMVKIPRICVIKFYLAGCKCISYSNLFLINNHINHMQNFSQQFLFSQKSKLDVHVKRKLAMNWTEKRDRYKVRAGKFQLVNLNFPASSCAIDQKPMPWKVWHTSCHHGFPRERKSITDFQFPSLTGFPISIKF